MSAEEPETEACAANDATEVVDDDFSTRLRNAAGDQVETQEAWSDEDDAVDDAESESQPWSVVTGHAAALLSVGAVVAAVIAMLGWMMLHKDRPAASARSSLAMPTNNAALSPSPIPLTTSAETARTQIITAVAVDARGQPADGYQEIPAGTSSELAGCDQPSSAAINANIYSCYPTAAAADVCWPSPPTSMLCMTNPWDKEVRRLSYDTSLLPTVQPPKTPQPFALVLDNGTHCLYISGGARRARSDGYIPDYACGADLRSYVLGDASGNDPINRSNLLWTVTFEQPGFQTQVRSVTSAWFAGN
jgi:hypothetical protein